MKCNPRQRAIVLADKALTEYVMARDKTCVTCGSPEWPQTSHVFRRTHFATRWDCRNAYRQCRSCHYGHHNYSEAPLIVYCQKHLGMDRFLNMQAFSHKITKYTSADILEIAEDLKRRRLELEGNNA